MAAKIKKKIAINTEYIILPRATYEKFLYSLSFNGRKFVPQLIIQWVVTFEFVIM